MISRHCRSCWQWRKNTTEYTEGNFIEKRSASDMLRNEIHESDISVFFSSFQLWFMAIRFICYFSWMLKAAPFSHKNNLKTRYSLRIIIQIFSKRQTFSFWIGRTAVFFPPSYLLPVSTSILYPIPTVNNCLNT